MLNRDLRLLIAVALPAIAFCLFIIFRLSTSEIITTLPGSQLAALNGAGSGLVAWWKMDEGTGTVAADTSGNGNNAILTNGPVWTSGQIGGGLSFNGTNNYVTPVLAPTNFSQPFTISALVKVNTLVGTHQIMAGSNGDVQFYQGGTALLYRTNGVSTSFDPVFNSINTWQQVVVTYDGATMTLYANGSAIANRPVTALNDTNISIGSFGNTVEFFSGAMDDVRVYNRALSAAEVSQLYSEAMVPPDVTPPVISAITTSGQTLNSATITWGTNEPADSQIEYGLSTAYGFQTGLDAQLLTTHSQTLGNLASNTLYHYRIRSKDLAGNLAVSGDNTFATLAAFSGTYYVDGIAGQDANPGSLALPFKTIQRAANAVNPGDTVIVRNGTYAYDGNGEKAIVTLTRGGNSSNWITFKAENRVGAIIDGQNNPSGAKFGFVLYSTANYVRIQDFEIKNFQNTDGNSGFMVYASNVNIVGNQIHDIGNQICSTIDRANTGMFVSGVGPVIVERNTFHDIGRKSLSGSCNATAPNLDHAMYLAGVSNSVVRNNLVYNIPRGWGIQIYSGGTTGSTGLTIANNTFAFANADRDGQVLLTAPGVSNTTIENNIFYGPTTAGVRITSPVSNVAINRNITYGGVISSVVSGMSAGITYSGNQDNTDPKMVNPTGYDFHLGATSPAIDAVSNSFSINTDLDGNSRPSGSAPDIGAYEFTGIVAPPVVTPTPTPIQTPVAVDPTPTVAPVVSDTTPPTVSVTAPLNGSTISGSAVPISASASDNVAVLTVQFRLDGVDVNPVFTTAPYSGIWDTTGISNGTHILTAVAVDSSGNLQTSATVTLTVSNTIVPLITPTPAVGSGGAPSAGSGGSTPAPVAGVSGGGGVNYSAMSSGTGSITPTVIQKPLAVTRSGSGGSNCSTVAVFTRYLSYGSTSEDVRKLQQFLNAQGFTVATKGNGSPGKETTYFGPATMAALVRFQKKYAITDISGVFGQLTLNKANALSVGTSVNCSIPISTPALMVSSSQNFTRNLNIGSTGADVKRLQQFLNAQGFVVAASGNGSAGNETSYYGPATFDAVKRFQEKYSSEILVPNGLTKGTGFFGPSTIKKINKMLGV